MLPPPLTYFPYPTFVQQSSKNSTTHLDVLELNQWADRVAAAGSNTASAINEIYREIEDLKAFIAFAAVQDPDIIQKFKDYKAVAAKTGAV